MVIVIHFLNFDTSRYHARAIGASDCANLVLAGLDQFFDNIFADVTANLLWNTG